jgi:hypothetical protein
MSDFESAPPAAPAAPSSSPAPSSTPSQTPFQRDVARTDAGRQEVERTRTDAAATRSTARGEATPQANGQQPDAGNADSAIDAGSMRSGERFKITGADGKTYTLGADDVQRLTEWNAADIQRKATMPASADAYEAKLPEGFQLPPGVEMKIDGKDPALGDLRAFAHKAGWSQDQFSDVLQIYAAREAKQVAAISAARNAEVGKLGTNGPSRVDAVATWWKAMTGDDGAVLGQILRMAPTAGTVQSLERLMQRFTTQGAAPFNHGGREGGGPSDRIEGWDKMSYEQRRFAQDQRARRL